MDTSRQEEENIVLLYYKGLVSISDDVESLNNYISTQVIVFFANWKI